MNRILGKNQIQELVERVAVLEEQNQGQQENDLIPSINLLDQRTEAIHENRANLISAVNTLDTNKADKVLVISPDATDLASTMLLLNEIKEKLNQ